MYDGDAARVWTTATTSDELRENIDGLPGYGKMKVKALGSVLFKRFDVALAEPLVPWHPTLGDVDSAEALANYQASKKAQQGLVGGLTAEHRERVLARLLAVAVGL